MKQETRMRKGGGVHGQSPAPDAPDDARITAKPGAVLCRHYRTDVLPGGFDRCGSPSVEIQREKKGSSFCKYLKQK